jgi:hypothetical protein
VYYSYEEWGRGYIGSKPSGCSCTPENDPYLGSFTDKTFKPTHKIILGVYDNPGDCIAAEVLLHSYFEVDLNPHFANLARQTSTGFVSLVKTEKHKENISRSLSGRKLSPDSIEKRQRNRTYATGDDHHMRRMGGHTPEAKQKIKEKRAQQTNVSGGCSHQWLVNEYGERTRSLTRPEDGWQPGMVWRGKIQDI